MGDLLLGIKVLKYIYVYAYPKWNFHNLYYHSALEALPSFSTVLRPSIKVIKAKKKAPAQDGRKKKKMMKQTCYSASSKSAIQPKKERTERMKSKIEPCVV